MLLGYLDDIKAKSYQKETVDQKNIETIFLDLSNKGFILIAAVKDVHSIDKRPYLYGCKTLKDALSIFSDYNGSQIAWYKTKFLL